MDCRDTRPEGADLAGRVRRGDRAAWRELCETYARPLYLYAYHRTGDSWMAEDVRQETLLAALRGISGYRGRAPLFAWLCGIARHKIADARHRVRREAANAGVGARLGREPLADELVERADTRSLVVEVLWSLPGDYREALLARYGEGMTVAEVARRLDRSYKAAESVLARARAAFRRRMREVEDT